MLAKFIVIFSLFATPDAFPPSASTRNTSLSQTRKQVEDGRDIVKPSKIRQRRSILQDAKLWPNAVVPYILHKNITMYVRQNLDIAFAEFNKYTCIKFKEVKAPYKGPHVLFESDGMCSSNVGMLEDGQTISATGCGFGGLMHEMMHALGFIHESQRSDRDDFIKIIWENVEKDMDVYFQTEAIKPNPGPYDCQSMMHSTNEANAIPGKISIKALDTKNCYSKDGKSLMGDADSFSSCDIQKMNNLYKCPPKAKKLAEVYSCKPAEVKRMPVPDQFLKWPEPYFCKEVAADWKKCYDEPGKYWLGCRKSCNNLGGGCWDTMDESLFATYCKPLKDLIGKNCNEKQKTYCPLECRTC